MKMKIESPKAALRLLLCVACMWLVCPQAQAFKRQFKTPQWICSNVIQAEITHIVLTDTATIVTFHKHNTKDGICFGRGTHLVDDQGRHYRIMRSQGLPDERFDNYFSKATNEANDFKLLFEPLPKKTRFFDLIESNQPRAFQILGIYDLKKPIEIPTFVDTVSTPKNFIRTDTVCVRGKIEGYSRSMGFSTMQIYLGNELTRENTPKAVNVREDGTFEVKFEAFYPRMEFLAIRRDKIINFYIVPGCTTVVNIHEDWTVDYIGSDKEVAAYERLMMSGITNIENYGYVEYVKDRDSLSFVEMQEKLMGLAKANEQIVDYIAWRNEFTPWEYHLARIWHKLEYAQWIFDYLLDARHATYKRPTGEDSIRAYSRLAEVSDVANWGFFRQMPYNDVASLSCQSMSTILNRYEYAPVLSAGFRVIKIEAENELREDSTILANDMVVTGEESPSLWGQIAVLRRTEHNFKHFRKDKEELKKLVDLRREMLTYPALQANLDRLYAKELARPSLTYSLPDTEATRILRRMTDKYKGKYLLIDFWGMGCGPCRSAIKHSKELRKALRDHPEVDFLFIAAPESSDEAYNNFVKENLDGEDCHLVTRDEYNQLMELFQFNGIPHYETLDKQGNVVRDGLNFGFYDKVSFENKVKILNVRLK